MAFPAWNPQPQFFDSSGSPLDSGTIEFRSPTDNSLIDSFPTADDADAQTNANANPLTLNSRGEAASGLYLEDGVKYKIILKDSSGSTVWTQDDVRCPVYSQASIGEKLYPQSTTESTAGVTPKNYFKSPGNVLRYGSNTTPGTTDMSTAFQDALDQSAGVGGAPVYVPAGTYSITTKLTATLTGANDNERILIYGDGAKSVINSTVVGDATLELSDSQFVTVERLRFVGNNSTGASGNGHAIAFRDSSPQSGTFYPQKCDVRDVSIIQFRGNDTENTNTTTGVTTVAAGIYMANGVANYIRRCDIDTCATGVHFDEAANSHIVECVIASCDNWGVEFDMCADGCSLLRSDVIANGQDGNDDASVYSGVLNYAGVLIENCDNSIVIEHNKFKNGQAVTVNASDFVTIRANYIRLEAPSVVSDSWGIQARSFGHINIEGNEFEYLAGTGANTANGVHLDSNNVYIVTTNFKGNAFNHAEFGGIDVKYEGSGANDSNFEINHIGNQHGSSRNGRTNSTCDDCINLDTLNAHGQISGNSFIVFGDGVSAGGTITDCLDISAIGSAASLSRLKIFGNKAREYLTGGTITNDIEAFQDNTPGTFTAADATPDISWKSVWHTDSGSLTITDFDGYPVNGRSITVISEGAVTFDVTGTSLKGGTVDIVTAAGDVTQWVLDTDGFTWRLVGFMDDSVDNSAGA